MCYPYEAFQFICEIYGADIKSKECCLTDKIDDWKNWSNLNSEPYLSRILTVMVTVEDKVVAVLMSSMTAPDEKFLVKLNETDTTYLKELNVFITSISKIAVHPNFQKQGIARSMIAKMISAWSEKGKILGAIISSVHKNNDKSLQLFQNYLKYSSDENNQRFIQIQ